ncbi:hypothetical protein [Hahella sp. CR1]|uniref:hypothetical protein n=1 Tax=unclassified Hahella TaxID=2624107 RepID=UPI002442CAA0|nr:hypothetical protein [Hahella sp. CR1]MDG9666927.1 hypothetical protein [Hahella sp. CR1]
MLEEIKEAKENGTLVSIERDEVDENCLQAFVLDYSDELVLLQYVYDFNLDGLMVIRMGDITDVYMGAINILQTQMLKEEGLYEKVEFDIQCDLSNWRTTLSTLGQRYDYLILEDENPQDPMFLMGKLAEVSDDYVLANGFDGEGLWDDEATELGYDEITAMKVNNNYINFYKRYFERNPSAVDYE